MVISVERGRNRGIIIEAGCALGGTALVMASAKRKGTPLFVYDVFGMIPPPSAMDGEDVHERWNVIASRRSEGINGGLYYGYEKDLYAKVMQTFDEFGIGTALNDISLIKGLFEDTMQIQGPVELVHIDCDWYDSVLICLQRIWPHLVEEGVMILDDYDAWSGCKRAVDEFLQDLEPATFQFLRSFPPRIVKR